MQENSALDELLVGFILKELDAEDEAFVQQLISASEENRLYFEKLEKTWKLAGTKEVFEQVDIDEEWKHFEQSIARKAQRLIPVKSPEIKVDSVPQEEFPQKKSVLKKLLLSLAVAATILLVVTWGWKYVQPMGSSVQTRAKKETPATTTEVFRHHEVNHTGKIRRLLLPDGSQVVLFKNSEIRYQEPFAANRRDINLVGKATFKVAKDAARPFTVFSSDLATTAIGTHFTVTAYAQFKHFSVRLNEGKVVVRSANLVHRTLKYDYYLLPGQELVYNHLNFTAKLVNFFAKDKPAARVAALPVMPDDLSVPENLKGSWYMFNNQGLGEVFDQLRVMFNVDIVYAKKDVRNMYFIGKFDKTDSLHTILEQIARLNNFKVTRKKDKYIITK